MTVTKTLKLTRSFLLLSLLILKLTCGTDTVLWAVGQAATPRLFNKPQLVRLAYPLG